MSNKQDRETVRFITGIVIGYFLGVLIFFIAFV